MFWLFSTEGCPDRRPSDQDTGALAARPQSGGNTVLNKPSRVQSVRLSSRLLPGDLKEPPRGTSSNTSNIHTTTNRIVFGSHPHGSHLQPEMVQINVSPPGFQTTPRKSEVGCAAAPIFRTAQNLFCMQFLPRPRPVPACGNVEGPDLLVSGMRRFPPTFPMFIMLTNSYHYHYHYQYHHHSPNTFSLFLRLVFSPSPSFAPNFRPFISPRLFQFAQPKPYS